MHRIRICIFAYPTYSWHSFALSFLYFAPFIPQFLQVGSGDNSDSNDDSDGDDPDGDRNGCTPPANNFPTAPGRDGRVAERRQDEEQGELDFLLTNFYNKLKINTLVEKQSQKSDVLQIVVMWKLSRQSRGVSS